MYGVTRAAKMANGKSQSCGKCCVKRDFNVCPPAFQRVCSDAFVEGFKKGARWAENKSWYECKENTEDVPELNTVCVLRIEYKEIATGIVEVAYLTAAWNEYGWTEEYLDSFDESEFEVTITHWKPINKPKGVEK